MPTSGPKRPIKLLTDIRRDLAEVDKLCAGWEEGDYSEEKERVDGLMQRAFESSLVLMETIGRSDTRNRILSILDIAKKNFHAAEYSVNAGEPYSVWSYQLSQILDAVERVQFELTRDVEKPLELIFGILDPFNLVERALQHRYNSRRT